MDNYAKENKDLTKIQQRLQIISPIIQDAHNACFSIGKFFATILITIHGGAIGLLVTSNDELIMDSASFFIIGIIFSLLLTFFLTLTIGLTVSQYRKVIIKNNFDINSVIKSINIHKSILYIIIYFSFLFSFSIFCIGVSEIAYIKFSISINEEIQQMLTPIMNHISMAIVSINAFINPLFVFLFVLISILIFWYKKYKDKIDKIASIAERRISNIIKFPFYFLARKFTKKPGVIVMKNEQS